MLNVAGVSLAFNNQQPLPAFFCFSVHAFAAISWSRSDHFGTQELLQALWCARGCRANVVVCLVRKANWNLRNPLKQSFNAHAVALAKSLRSRMRHSSVYDLYWSEVLLWRFKWLPCRVALWEKIKNLNSCLLSHSTKTWHVSRRKRLSKWTGLTLPFSMYVK